MALIGNSSKITKKNLFLFFSNCYKKTEEEGMLPNSFYEATITPIPKPAKNTTKLENHRPIFLMNIGAKILNKLSAYQIQQYIKRIKHHDQVEFIPESQDGSIYTTQSVQYITLTKRQNPHDHLYTEKAFDKIQYSSMIKTLHVVQREYMSMI